MLFFLTDLPLLSAAFTGNPPWIAGFHMRILLTGILRWMPIYIHRIKKPEAHMNAEHYNELIELSQKIYDGATEKLTNFLSAKYCAVGNETMEQQWRANL